MFTKCPVCRGMNKDNERFCKQCGTALMEDPLEHEEKLQNFLILLKSSDKNMKQSAIKALGEIKGEESLEAITKNLEGETDWELRKESVLALKNFDEEDIIKVLSDTFKVESIPEVRITIMGVIKDFKSREATNLLITACQDSFADIQQKAIAALGDKKDRKALEPLFDILKDEKSLFREDARISIEKIDNQFLKFWYEEEKNKEVKQEQKKQIPLIIGIIVAVVIMAVIIITIVNMNKKKQVEARIAAGNEFLYKEDYTEALKAFNEVIFSAPKEPYGYYGMGMVYLNTGKKKDALEVFQQAVSLNPQNAEFLMALARAEIENDKPKDALRHLEEAKEIDRDLADIYLYMGEAYFKMGEKAQALQYFNYCMETFYGTEAGKKAKHWSENWREIEQSESEK